MSKDALLTELSDLKAAIRHVNERLNVEEGFDLLSLIDESDSVHEQVLREVLETP